MKRQISLYLDLRAVLAFCDGDSELADQFTFTLVERLESALDADVEVFDGYIPGCSAEGIGYDSLNDGAQRESAQQAFELIQEQMVLRQDWCVPSA